MKSRYWAFIVYPESVLENWRDELEEQGLVFAVSPLHDKDINPTGEKKKEHYHVLIEFSGPKTYKSVKEGICDKIGATIPKKVESIRGYYRYLTHEDNPEKAQYNREDIKEYNGFKLELTITETTIIKKKICQIIQNMKIKEYCDLLDYFDDIGDHDYWEIASNNTYFFDKYITSVRNKEKEERKKEEETERKKNNKYIFN